MSLELTKASTLETSLRLIFVHKPYDLFSIALLLLPTQTTLMSDSEPEPVEFPINGELDLHTFRPSDLGDLIPDYIEACLEKGIFRLRIIHGKGIGTLRDTVHSLLKRDPRVDRFQLADQTEGSWGATIVWLKEQ